MFFLFYSILRNFDDLIISNNLYELHVSHLEEKRNSELSDGCRVSEVGAILRRFLAKLDCCLSCYLHECRVCSRVRTSCRCPRWLPLTSRRDTLLRMTYKLELSWRTLVLSDVRSSCVIVLSLCYVCNWSFRNHRLHISHLEM